MKTKTFVILGGTGIALYLVWNRREEITETESKEFEKGYVAGFFTPGPFTILAIAGLATYS